MSSTDLHRLATRLSCAAALLAGAALAGCATAPPRADKAAANPRNFVPDAVTPLDQYAVTLDHAQEQVALSVHPTGVSANQRKALQAFAERWRDGGGVEAMSVQAPVNSAEPADARAAAQAVAALLQALGVPSSRLQLAQYDGGGRPGAPVLVRYERDEAKGPDCRDGWENLMSTRKNATGKHFGCAGAANLAAMIANPHDLEHPAPTAPADSVRRSVVLDKYRLGQTTASQKDPQAAGVLDGGVN